MTADRIQYFEERLKKPIPEPFKSWMEELFAEAKWTAKAKGNHAPANVPVIERNKPPYKTIKPLSMPIPEIGRESDDEE